VGSTSDLLWFLAEGVQRHSSLIYLLVGAVSALFAFVFILPRRSIWFISELWAKYFGLAFAFFALQYFLLFLTRGPTSPASAIAAACTVARALMFLIAARLLLGRRPPVPRWALLIAAAALACDLAGPSLSVLRLPGPLFSGYCYALIGYAVFSNISYRRRRLTAGMALIFSLTFILLELAYGLNPVLARSLQFDLPVLDSIVFAAGLPIIMGLFFPAYHLLILSMTSTSGIQKLSARLSKVNQEYFSGGGIARTIAESLHADRVDVSLRLPGRSRRLVESYVWRCHGPDYERPVLKNLDDETDPLLRQVFRGGGEPLHSETGPGSLCVTPIYFQGAVIGSLTVELQGGHAFSELALGTIQTIATMLSTSAQSYRELAALEQLSHTFSQLRAARPVSSNETARSAAEILYEVLSPLAVGIFIDIGFRPSRAVCPGEGVYSATITEGLWCK
jgi:hypothetical protein